MGIFDYNCYIENNDCPLSESNGQEFTSGWIYAVNRKLTKKLPCYYSGYGYATLDYDSNDKIHDLIEISWGMEKDNINDKTSFFACPNCAECIENECNDWKEFYDPIEEIKENIKMHEKEIEMYFDKIEMYGQKLLNCINEQRKLLNRINETKLLIKKEKKKL